MKRIFPIFYLSLLLIGCSYQWTAPTGERIPTSYPSLSNTNYIVGYPIASPELLQNLRNGALLDFEVDRTPTSGNGIVKGTILVNGSPVANVNLFLAGFVKDSLGNDAVGFVSPGNSPETKTNEDGQFTFINVPLGTYGIVLENYGESYMLLTPDGSETLLTTVGDREVTDVGTLDYDFLPLE